MTEFELEKLKKASMKEYYLSKINIFEMEQTSEVKKYLEELKKMQEQKEYYEYLNNLKFCKNEVITSPKLTENTKYYGLSFLFNCALSLKYYASSQEKETGIDITYDELLDYLNQAQKKIQENTIYEDDYIQTNPYNLEIYRNPANYSILEKEEDKEFRNNLYNFHRVYALNETLDKYQVNEAIIYKTNVPPKKSYFMVLPRNIEKIALIEINSLTQREKETFFGQEAQKSLNISIEELKNKSLKKLK